MANSSNSKKPKRKLANFTNLDDVVEKWALQMFDATASDKQKKIPKDCLHMEINWKKVRFCHSEPDFDQSKKMLKPQSQVLFKSNFTNETECDQEYSFKTERTSSSTAEVEFEQCYTVGMELNFSLGLPDEIFSAGAGFHKELSCTKMEGQCIEESMTWGVDNTIKVPRKTKVTAELVISEEQSDNEFTVTSEFAGPLSVSFTNLNDNNSFVKSVTGDIVTIFKHAKVPGFSIEDKKVITQTKGKCQFRFGIEQHVKVSKVCDLE